MIEVNNLGLHDSLFNDVMAEIRDEVIQRDRMRFRRNLERVGEIMAYEISKTLEYEPREVITPLGVKEVRVLKEQPVLATILRAGIPFHNGLLNMFDKADNAFVAAYRQYDKDDDSEIRVEYFSAPDLNDRVLIVCDPLLATGESLVKTIEGLLGDDMQPKHIHIAVAVASADGRCAKLCPCILWEFQIQMVMSAEGGNDVGVFVHCGNAPYGIRKTLFFSNAKKIKYYTVTVLCCQLE